jgi:soluble lytic murein transglycosylase-like protein
MRFCFQTGVVAAALVALGSPALRAEINRSSKWTAVAPAKTVARLDPRSGQQVRTIVVPPRAITTRQIKPLAIGEDIDGGATAEKPLRAADSNVQAFVEEAALKYDVNPALIDSVIQVESSYNPRAVSPKGAQGLMQLMPDTARRLGVSNPFDPRENVLGGAKYLKFLQETFKDDRLAIAAYNAGEGAVAKYNNVPPFLETINYVAQVGKRYSKAKKAAEAKKAAAAQPKPEKPPEPQFARVRQFLDAEGKLHLTTQ